MGKVILDYLEFPSRDLAKTKAFFTTVFEWDFVDYGEEYTSFCKKEAGLDGGFYLSNKSSRTDAGAALAVFQSDNLAATQAKIEDAGGEIIHEIFSFPGGSRFHFADPTGNEFAVWSKTE